VALDEIVGMAGNGDVVILSPGCSSFDMFSSFEERGDTFKKLVNKLI
jgi:UDP-N-acetylmuramoylalanine--D-glutamate ligase